VNKKKRIKSITEAIDTVLTPKWEKE
jgi:hypothetical protein